MIGRGEEAAREHIVHTMQSPLYLVPLFVLL